MMVLSEEKWRQIGRRSQRKGKEGEREVGRLLYKAHYGEEPTAERDTFIRTKLGSKQPYGDLIVPDDFPFVVSVKNFVIAPLGSDMKKVWSEVCQLAIGVARQPMLVFRWYSNRQWIVRFKPPKDIPLKGLPAALSYWDTVACEPESFLCFLQDWCEWWAQLRK